MPGLFDRFARNTRGNFALLAAAAAVPLSFGTAMTLDVVAIKRSQSALQQATDAAVLAIAREGVTISDQAAYVLARDILVANLTILDRDLLRAAPILLLSLGQLRQG